MCDELEAVTVVSPACVGGEEKDQDRAGWHPATGTGAVCDGTSASLSAEVGAALGVQFSPVLFQGDPADREDVAHRLRAFCDLLVTHRLSRRDTPAHQDARVHPAMHAMIDSVLQEKQTRSFQTTLIAARFVRIEKLIQVTVVGCGDSSFIAFARDGTPLACWPPVAVGTAETSASAPITTDDGHPFRFGPGDELLVKVAGWGDRFPRVLVRAGIPPTSVERWLLVQPVDQATRAAAPSNGRMIDALPQALGPADYLAIPRYLIGNGVHLVEQGYLRARFARAIRVVSRREPGQVENSPRSRTNVTTVLPDHFYSGAWVYFQEQYPADAQFLLASDGFTDCFDRLGEMWDWLHANGQALASAEARVAILQELHERLHRRRGDDDISLVWVHAKETGHGR